MPKPAISIRIVIPLSLGILVGRLLDGFNGAGIQFTVYLSIALLIFIISYLYNSTKVYNQLFLKGILLNILLINFGLLCCKAHADLFDSGHFSYQRAGDLKIVICSEPQQQGPVIVFQAQVLASFYQYKKSPVKGKILIMLRENSKSGPLPSYGQSYLIPARYLLIKGPQNPAEFDYRFWLSNQNIYHQSYLAADELRPLKSKNRNWLLRFAIMLRQGQLQKLRGLMKNSQAYAVAATLILGYRANLSADTLSAYSKTGTIHALSVSGMHVGIIFFVLDFLLKKLDKNRLLKGIKTVLILCLIWGYTLLSGYSPSILRSALMISLFILSKIFKKNCGNWQPFCLSAVLLLLWNPALIFDAGCQLSYLAVAGLIYLQPKIEKWYTFKNFWLQKLWSLMALSLAAQLFTMPLSVWYFHQFPLYFLLSNLFITLPVTLLMYSGISILLFNLNWLAPAFEWLIIFMNKGLEWIARLPYPVIEKIWLSATEMLLLCLVILCACMAFQLKSKKLFYMAVLAIFFLQAMLSRHTLRALKQHRLVMYKITRHHAAALLYGRRAVVITDLRADQKNYKFHVQPALDQALIKESKLIKLEVPGP